MIALARFSTCVSFVFLGLASCSPEPSSVAPERHGVALESSGPSESDWEWQLVDSFIRSGFHRGYFPQGATLSVVAPFGWDALPEALVQSWDASDLRVRSCSDGSGLRFLQVPSDEPEIGATSGAAALWGATQLEAASFRYTGSEFQVQHWKSTDLSWLFCDFD